MKTQYPSYEEPSQPEYHCVKNLCKDGAKVPDGYVAVAGVKNNWEIGTVGKDTLIVSIANMGMSGAHEYKQWEDLIKTFDSLYEKYPHIILDARNNGGGEDKPIHHIVCRLNGNPVNPFSSASVRDTPLSRHLLQHTGMCKKVPEEEKVAGTHCSGRIETLMDETRNFYPFNEQTGYKGRIDVLIDGRTASAGESAYSLFYCLPNVRFVGENTRGMQHYRQARIATPWGGRISVGVMSLDYLHGQMYEMTGNPPDVKVKEGVDALKIALDPATIDLFRQDGFRPEIQEMQERVKSKKSPQYEPDERLTANAGIDGITPDNKATDVRRSQFGNSIVSGLRRIDERNASCDERAPLLRCEGLVPTTPPCVPQQPSKPEALKNNLIIDKIKQRDM